ncbi:hypothetical protein EU96_1564 [Prochlorococcus marinus str. MIT 9302]|uniref:CotH protein n=1 Tax=Prochlorococcus marinus str. MIT 9302 TaxID=74545 RepID=A0A0A2A5P8_PROMR|nr:hypothetical protein EU96_1564 [Prochlorococcus marinus str. MIT 9302]
MKRFINNRFNLKVIVMSFITFLIKSQKKLYKPALFIFYVQILLVSLFYFHNKGHINKKLKPVIYNTFDSLYIQDYIGYFKDLILSFNFNNKIERIDIQLDFENIVGLDCTRKQELGCKNDPWLKGNLLEGDINYPIKIRSKGDRRLHRESFKSMSYKIDIRGEQRYKGMEEFSIQMPIIRNYTYELYASNLLRKAGIISPRNHYVKLFLNGEYLGIRHVEEGFARELIESNKKRFGPIFSIDEEYGDVYENTIFKPLNKNYWINNNSNLLSESLSVLEASRSNPEIIKTHFDLDKWAKYFAYVDSLKLFHATRPGNLKFYLNPSSGKFEPIFFDGHLGMGYFDNFHLSDYLLMDGSKPDCRWTCTNEYFYRLFTGTPENPNLKFYESYKEYLKEIVSKDNRGNLKNEWNELSNERRSIYREFSGKDSMWNKGLLPHISAWKPLEKRLIEIENLIYESETKEPNFSYDSQKNIIYIKNNYSRFPQLIGFKCGNYKSEKNILIKGGITKFKLDNFGNCNLNQLLYTLDNFKNTKEFKSSNLTNFSFDKELINPIRNLPIKKTFEFISGDHKLSNSINIFNSNVIFHSGSSICLENDSYINIENSNIDIRGTEKNPVEISACNIKKEYANGGSLIFQDSNIKISNLNLNNLNAPNKRLRILYGGANFINSEINIDKLRIVSSNSEDAINFIDSNLEANYLEFINSQSDALDSDFSNLNINRVKCSNVGNDCVDFSFSLAKINQIESYLTGDKSISLGEASILKAKNVNLKDGEIGIVSKDYSKLNIKNYAFSNIRLPIASFVKKPEFQSPELFIENIKPNLGNNYLIGKDVKAIISGKKLTSDLLSSEVEDKLYGNFYGTKTQR